MTGEYLLGVDLGGTNCRAALVSPGGGIGDIRRMETRIEEGRDSLLARLGRLCEELRDVAAGEGRHHCLALGMGTAGAISPDGTVLVSPNLPPLDGVRLAERMRARLGLPVRVVNDANAIAWGEFLFGAGRTFSSFLAMTLGTGVGGGLVLENRLWEGPDGTAGEIGHFTVQPDGIPCACGNRGCLEQYASASGIVREIQRRLAAGEESLLAGTADKDLTSRKAADAARQGDRPTLEVFREAGRRLGQVLAGVANLLDLDGAVITGGASESFELMAPALRREIMERAFEVPARRLRIVRGELGDNAGIQGAARLALDSLGG